MTQKTIQVQNFELANSDIRTMQKRWEQGFDLVAIFKKPENVQCAMPQQCSSVQFNYVTPGSSLKHVRKTYMLQYIRHRANAPKKLTRAQMLLLFGFWS